MARFKTGPLVGEGRYNETWLISSSVDDNDVGKPVKVSTATDNLVELCSDGDQIYGFIESVETGTTDGYVKITVKAAGRVWVETSGTVVRGGMVEAAANTAAGVAKAGDYGLVSAHTVATGTEKMWKVISGATLTDGNTILISKQ